ncbi:MAG TPA: hypothetical protein VFX31_04220 [Ktedonobacterales bacterium]|jgi:hypothetical protein|nr:hypothetical protein [Ktedonobacterales bacterium]HEX5570568.1 hypothetical protein [Ktedonobacterales bacterium]
MSAGRERGALVWDAREHLLRQRLEAAQAERVQIERLQEPLSRKRRERLAELEQEVQRLTLALARLGPSPRAKMG